ncbi:DPP IV N-terminal domain-containing protein [Acidobacteria bacterium AH-259-O06]|nr:DPP IV N-terminal domain-containing protein [Acidobacteria bacterium AH-259-O06]
MRIKVGWIVLAIGALWYLPGTPGTGSGELHALPQETEGSTKDATEKVVLHLEEGTNMSAAASPDGQWIAIDLLEDLWLVPADGGEARRLTSDPSTELDPRWSPDGQRLVFSSDRAGNFDLWVLEVASGQMWTLTSGPSKDREPDWSPDGNSIAFVSDRRWATGDLYVVPASGGEVKALTADPASDLQPAYSPDGRWIAFASNRSGEYQIWKIPTRGGEAQIAVESGIRSYCPAWSKDGRLVWGQFPQRGSRRRSSRAQLWIGSNGQESARALTDPADLFRVRPSRLPNGDIVFVADGKIHAVDPDTKALREIPFEATFTFTKNHFTPRPPKLVGPGRYAVRGIQAPKISRDGTRVAFAALDDIWVLTIGNPKPIRITDATAVNTWPAWSPDGQRIVFSSDRARDYDLWSVSSSGGQPIRLTSMAGSEVGPVFSPDGDKIAFSHFGMREHHIYWIRKDGGETHLLTRIRGSFDPSASFSPDRKRLYFPARGPEGTRSVNVAYTSSGGGAPRFLTRSPRVLSQPTISADGRKLIYRDLGRLWLQELSAGGEPQGDARSLTEGLAIYPSLSGDGKRLCYLSPQGLFLLDLDSGKSTPIPLEFHYEVPANRSSLLVRNVRLIDGTGSLPKEAVDILVRNGRVARVAPTGRVPAQGIKVLEAAGKTAIPGLIDLHTHSNRGYEQQARLYFGVTSYRDVGTSSYHLLTRVEAIHSGRETGPRVFYAGEVFDGPQAGYAQGLLRLEIDNEAQAIAHLERLAGLGYHATKATLNEGIPGPLQQAIIDKSHALGRPVTGHWSVQAILRGTDGNEHMPQGRFFRSRPYDDYLQLAARSGIWLTPTLGVLMPHKSPEVFDAPALRRLLPAYILDRLKAQAADPSHAEAAKERHELELPDLRRIRQLGGKVVAGSDTPLAGLSLHWELQHLVEAGMTPMEALLAATRDAAAALGYPDDLGTIEEGKIADIVLLDADPLEEITNTLRIATVIHDGKVVDREALLR